MFLRSRRRKLLVGPLVLGLALLGGGPVQGAATDNPLEGKRIVISNDDSMQNSRPDGSDGEGIYELRKVFCEAGADVVVVAPWGYQSGAGTAVTNSGVFHMQEPDELPERYASDCLDAPSGGPVFGVCQPIDGVCTDDARSATPTDTVKLAVRGGLEHVLGWTQNPDLVLSGINSGPNLGSSVNDSGTAGAALAALSVNTPGIAISAWATGDDHQQVYERTARFTGIYVAEVLRQDALTTDYVTNINFPNIAANADPEGVEVVPVGTGTTARHSYDPTGDLTFDVGIRGCEDDDPSCVPETRDDADYLVNLAGYVTIAPLTPDRTYQGETPELDSVVDAVEEAMARPTEVCSRHQGGASFPDSPGSGHGYFIDCLAELGIVQGFNDGTFRPALQINRGQLATYVVNAIEVASGVPLEAGGEPFPDVDEDSTHGEAIHKLRNAGIIQGYADGTFRPDGSVSREQTARYVVNALEYVLDAELPTSGIRFPDVTSTQYRDDIDKLATAGVIQGFGDGTFRPRQVVTRGQMARFVANGLEVLAAEGAYRGP